ncbi:MAG TPA: hypothetical protein ACQGQH_01980 [Xylella sp.]
MDNSITITVLDTRNHQIAMIHPPFNTETITEHLYTLAQENTP